MKKAKVILVLIKENNIILTIEIIIIIIIDIFKTIHLTNKIKTTSISTKKIN